MKYGVWYVWAFICGVIWCNPLGCDESHVQQEHAGGSCQEVIAHHAGAAHDRFLSVWRRLDLLLSVRIDPADRSEFVRDIQDDVTTLLSEVSAISSLMTVCVDEIPHIHSHVAGFTFLYGSLMRVFCATFPTLVTPEEAWLSTILERIGEKVYHIERTLECHVGRETENGVVKDIVSAQCNIGEKIDFGQPRSAACCCVVGKLGMQGVSVPS